MTTRITVNLPDNVYKRIQHLAELSGRDVEETIATTLDGFIPQLRSEMDIRPVETLTNEEVIALSDSMMDEAQSSRMSMLAHKQQASTLNDAERAELSMLLEVFEAGQLRKTQALEAI